MSDLQDFILPVVLPKVVLEVLPQPKFHLGAIVRWFQVPNGDFVWVISIIYTQEASCEVVGLHYLVMLDEKSPSRKIVSCDFVFENDLQQL